VDEAEVLTEIMQQDPVRKSRCVQMYGSFMHNAANFCIVFEPLDISLRDYLKANERRGLPMADVQEVSRQFLHGLSFLHFIGLTHTDLKCRNVMLRDGSHDLVPFRRGDGNTRLLKNCDVVLIDFGGAVFRDDRHDSRIGTRQFRAPELVLGIPWDEMSDLWSAGCIISMLYLGERPFSVHEDSEHLAMMEKLIGGQIPSEMIAAAAKRGTLSEEVAFDADHRLVWPTRRTDPEAVTRVQGMLPLRRRVAERHSSFVGLLEGLFKFSPVQRTSASKALQDAFFAIDDLPE